MLKVVKRPPYFPNSASISAVTKFTPVDSTMEPLRRGKAFASKAHQLVREDEYTKRNGGYHGEGGKLLA